jgi:transposase
MEMKTVGVDLHKYNFFVVVLDEHGQVTQRDRFPTKCRNQIREWFRSCGPQCQVAVESVGFYQWFWDLVQPLVTRIVLANPAGLTEHRPRKKAKTDRNDAELLARLLFDGRLPTAYVPPRALRPLRELVRHRHGVARSLALQRRCLRWLSLKLNLPGPKSLTSEATQKWLLAQANTFNPTQTFVARQRLDQIIALERQLTDVEGLIDQLVDADPWITHRIQLMETVPGVGRIAAITILAECGDLTRFNNIDQLGAFAGLVPDVRISDRTRHYGHISKLGPPTLRWVLQQAAWVAIRIDIHVRRIWLRISRRAASKRAATAVGRKILGYCWSVCRRNEPFHWPEEPIPEMATTGWSYSI